MSTTNGDRGLSRILLATDGSADASLAARAAIDLSSRASAVLDIVNAWGVPTGPAARGWRIDELLEKLEAESHRLIETVVADATAAGVHVGEIRSVRTPAADAVITVAEELGDDLIVVGSRGLGPVRRLLMGSVSDAIVHHANTAVLVVRGGVEAWPPQAVVAADDGEEATWPALHRAADVAHLVGAHLQLVEVLSLPARLSYVSDEHALAAARAHLDTRAGRLVGVLRARPDTSIRIGDAADELLKVADPGDRCLIVSGSHGRNALQRVRLGSVSSTLVHAAECPVLIVPRSAAAEEEGIGRLSAGGLGLRVVGIRPTVGGGGSPGTGDIRPLQTCSDELMV